MSIAVMASAVGPVLFSQSLTWTGSYRLAAVMFIAAAAGLLMAALRCDASVSLTQPAARASCGTPSVAD